jgi:hypothetical protein
VTRFEWNKDAVAKVMNQAVSVRAEEIQALFDALGPECAGRDVEEVKAVLTTRWAEDLHGSITDPELTAYAEVLASGQPIRVEQQQLTAEDLHL